MQWIGVGDSNLEANSKIMVLISATNNEEQDETNLFISETYGDDWKAAPGIDEVLVSSTFSEVPSQNGGAYLAFGVPLREASKLKSEPHLWISTDNGGVWSRVGITVRERENVWFETVVPNPTNADQFLASDSDSNAYLCSGAEQAATNNEIRDCHLLASPAQDMDWLNSHGGSGSTVLLIEGAGSNNQSFIHWHNAPDASGKSPPFTGGNGIGTFEQTNQYVFLTDLPDNSKGMFEKNLYVSSDHGKTFQQAHFPFEGRNNHYAVVDASEDMVMVAVDHNKTRMQGDAMVHIWSGGMERTAMAFRALFSEVIPQDGTLRKAIYYDSNNAEGCPENGALSEDVRGKYLLLKRGICKFIVKAQAAATAGAIGLVIENSDETHRLYMQAPSGSNYPLIPVVLVNRSAGEALIDDYEAGRNPTINMMEENMLETMLYKQTVLYHSDASGVNYAVSLKDVVYAAEPDLNSNVYVDVYKVASMNGTYIANYKKTMQSGFLIPVSVISYNKGASWWTLRPPEDHRCVEGLSGCSLHLVLESRNQLDATPMPQSTETAVGLIIANAYMDSSTDDTMTVVSRDGGQSWHQIEDKNIEGDNTVLGRHDYRILDHGSIIVMIPFRTPTSKIDYSVDEARNGAFYSYDFTANPDGTTGQASEQTIQGLISEPGGHSTTAFIYWYSDSWQGMKLEFSSVLPNECNANSDYDRWVPNILSGDCTGSDGALCEQATCILGEERTYRRRKPCSLCINRMSEWVSLQSRTCECQSSDFKCVSGFHRPSNIDTDKDQCVTDSDAQQPGCDSDGARSMTVMDKISRDTCTSDGGFLRAVDVPCDASRAAEGLAEEIAKGFGYLVGACVLTVLLLAFVFTFSKDARDAAIGTFGTDGKIGRFLSKFACFRAQESYVYSILSEETTTGLVSADTAGLYDEDSEDSEEDGDDLLFDLDDTQMEGANEAGQGLPIYTN